MSDINAGGAGSTGYAGSAGSANRSLAAMAAAANPGQPDDSSGAVVWMYQRQKKIYPRSVSGRFATWRWTLVWVTQLLFYGLPWLSWNDRPAVLFDLGARRFYIGALVLYPQDFIYLTGALVISAFALFLFTAVAGRLWCGFACPQTVYTELFMWVERVIEGERAARMRLDAGGWTLTKLWRKSAKHAVWIAIGLWTGLTFVGYFTPIRSLSSEALALSFGPWEWFWILFYGLATYGNAGWLREQVCKYMCPYARFQSAMFDKDTLIIGYDAARGEPRGPRGKKTDLAQAGLGTCIDCRLCVHVCPTGIDIRQGLQYECIGCAACVDVCDGVMDKMGYPPGLIRYDTENGLAQQLPGQDQGWIQALRHVLRPRVLVYSAILGLIVLGFGISLAMRQPFRVDVVRDRAVMARQAQDGEVENVYRLQLMNATEKPQRLALGVEGLPGIHVEGRHEFALASAQAQWVVVSVRLAPDAAAQAGAGAHPIHFQLALVDAAGQTGATVTEKSSFVVPR